MIETSSGSVFSQDMKNACLGASLTIGKKETCLNPIVLIHRVQEARHKYSNSDVCEHARASIPFSDKQTLSFLPRKTSNMVMHSTSPKFKTYPIEASSIKIDPSIQSCQFATWPRSQGESSKESASQEQNTDYPVLHSIFNSVQRSGSESERISKYHFLNQLKLLPVACLDRPSTNQAERSTCKLGHADGNNSFEMSKDYTTKCGYENMTTRKSLLTVPVSSPLGQNFLKRKSLCSYFHHKLKKHKIKSLPDREDIKTLNRMSKTINGFPLVFRGYRRKRDEAYFHKYNFTKKQKTDFHHRLRTGLDFKSRALLKTMKCCHVFLHHLTDSDFHEWMPTHKQMVVNNKHCHVLLHHLTESDFHKWLPSHKQMVLKLNSLRPSHNNELLDLAPSNVKPTMNACDINEPPISVTETPELCMRKGETMVQHTHFQDEYFEDIPNDTCYREKIESVKYRYAMHDSRFKEKRNHSSLHGSKTTVHSTKYTHESGISFPEGPYLLQQQQKPTPRIVSKLPHTAVLDFRNTLSNSNPENTLRVVQDRGSSFTEGQDFEHQHQQKPTTKMVTKLPHATTLDLRHILSNSNSNPEDTLKVLNTNRVNLENRFPRNTNKSPKYPFVHHKEMRSPGYHSKTMNADSNCNAPGVKTQAKDIHDNDQTKTISTWRKYSQAHITRFPRKFKTTSIRVAEEGQPMVQLPLQEPFWFMPINQGKRHTDFHIPCSTHSLFCDHTYAVPVYPSPRR